MYIEIAVVPDYSVLVSISCPKVLYHSESDNLSLITLVADWLG